MELIIDIPFLIALTIGLTEIIKRLFPLNGDLAKRFIPAIALLSGVALTLLWLGQSNESILKGIFIGLSGSGLWSGSKATLGKS